MAMRLPRPRFTVRWLMVAVAAVAAVVWADRMWRARSEYLKRAGWAGTSESLYEEILTDLLGTSRRGPKESRESYGNGFVVRTDYRYGGCGGSSIPRPT